MILGTGGNTGTQSSTLIIRSLSVGDIEIKDWLKIFLKEMTVGLLLGAILGITAFLRGMWESHGDISIPLVISFSMVTTVVWANIVGAMLPLLLAKFKLDPAVISSPLISTFTDITGMLIYFNVAIRLLHM
jgi:magnesium transporter